MPLLHQITGGLLLLLSSAAFAEPLCGLAKVSRGGTSGEEFQLKFELRKNFSILAVSDKGSAEYELKQGALKRLGKAVDAVVVADAEAKIYAVEGVSESCVLYAGEQDGKSGFFVEEYRHVLKEPPQLRTAFIEVE